MTLKYAKYKWKLLEKTKHLGVVYDYVFVSSINKQAIYVKLFSSMWNLAAIRKSCDLQTANIAAATYTTSSLDYCNAWCPKIQSIIYN